MKQFTPRYDADAELELAKGQGKMHAIFKNLPPWKQELARHKGVVSLNRTLKKRVTSEVERIRAAREDVEAEAAATLRKCADALQQALDAVNDTPVPQGKYQSHFNVRAVTDMLFVMRKKMKV